MPFIGFFYYVGRFVENDDDPGWVLLEMPRNYGITTVVSAPLQLDDVERAAVRAGMWSIGDSDFQNALKGWGGCFYPDGFVQFRRDSDECKRLLAALLETPGVQLLGPLGEFATWQQIFGDDSS